MSLNMLYIVCTLGVVLVISAWAAAYAEYKKGSAIEAAAAEAEAQFWADWSWDITQEPYYPKLKKECDESRRLITLYFEKRQKEYEENVRLSTILS